MGMPTPSLATKHFHNSRAAIVSTMVATTNVLITGCNRGIGNGLLTTYLPRPNHVVIGTARGINSSLSAYLNTIPKGENSRLILLKLDSASTTDASNAVGALKLEHQISHLDIVIANAGISSYFGPARITPPAEMISHFTVNTMGPLLLFQATAPLLDCSSDLNFVTRKIHMENPGIIAFPINPGWLRTDLGNHAATGAGMEQAPISVVDGISGVVDKIDHATRASTSGKFLSGQDDTTLSW